MLRYKITPPVLQRSVPRPRLLGAALAGRCIVLAAPAGHGKTSLAVQLADAAAGPTAWFSADELDRDVAGVVTHLLAALGQAWPDLSGSAPSTVEDDAALPLLGTALETLAGPGCLVIDDAHRLPEHLFERVTRTAVQALPAECRLIVCTRSAVPASLVRAEAAGMAVTLGPNDLVFTADECAELHGLDAAGGVEIHARTGGWPLAVALSAEAARVEGPAGTGLRHAEVLAELAFGDLPPAARANLAVLARLPRFPAALLTALGDAARSAIESLARRHPSILQPADEGWWVVREWLQNALAEDPLDGPTIDAVASALRRLDERELLVHLLLSDGRHTEAVADLERLVLDGAAAKRWGWVRALVTALPEEVRTLDLELAAARAADSLNLFEGEATPQPGLLSEAYLLDLVARARATGTALQQLRAQVVLADHYRMAGDVRLLVVCEQALGDALAVPDPVHDLPGRWSPGESEAAGTMLRFCAVALLVAADGAVVARGRRLLAAALDLLAGQATSYSERLWSLYIEALLWLRPAPDAARLMRPGARRLQELGQFDAGVRLGELAVLEYYAGDIAGARRTIEMARDCADRVGQRIVDKPLDAVEAVIDIAEHGLSDERAERFERAHARLVSNPRQVSFASPFAAEAAMQLVWQGELEAAARTLDQAEATVGNSLFAHVAAINCERVRGMLELARGDTAAGEERLARIRALAEAEGRTALVERIDTDAARLRTTDGAQPVAGPAGGPGPGGRRGPVGATGPVAVIVRVLGPTLQVDVGGEPAPAPRGYPAKLLALLVANEGVMTVDAAIEGLWPGANADLGRNRFYGVLLRLRRSLGLPVDGPITCVEGMVRLEAGDGLTVDGWAFERAARQGSDRLGAAAGYTGDVLSGQFAYDDAVAGYRARLRRTFFGLARDLLEAAAPPPAGPTDPTGPMDPDDLEQHVELARRIARSGPDDERLSLAAARTLAAAGHTGEARDLVDGTARTLTDLGLDGDAFRARALAD